MRTLILTLALSVAISVKAQWPNDPAVNLPLSNTNTTTSSLNPKAVSDGNGGAIVVWSHSSIYGQRVSSSGHKLWEQNSGLPVGSLGDPVFLSFLVTPVAVSDGSGGAIIAWAEFNAGRVIAASRVGPDGTIAWQRLACLTNGLRKNPAIVSDGAGGAIITWEDTRNGSANADIFAQWINSSGATMWGTNGVAICTAVNNQIGPRIASDGMGGAFITWTDNRTTSSRIYAQLVNPLGQLQWGTNGLLIAAGNEAEANPRIAASAMGEAIITWTHGTGGGTWDVHAQKVNQTTNAWALNGIPICNEIRTQWKPEIVADGFGGAIISWQDTRRISFNEEDVYAQRVDSGGGSMWGSNGIPICTQPGNSAALHTIASDGDGGAIIAWEDSRNGNKDLYAQRVHRSGSTLWSPNGVAVSTAPGTQAAATLVGDGNGGAIAAWYDSRRGPLDIYGQGVDSAGALGTTLSPPVFTTHPQSQTIYAGTNAIFSANAAGTPNPSYQWRFNSTNISGATNSGHLITGAQPSDAGNYVVVATNSSGSVTSAVAVLTVLTNQATLSAPVWTNNTFQFTVSQLSGLSYIIQANTNLSTTNWISIATNTAPFTVTDPASTNNPQRFYRAVP